MEIDKGDVYKALKITQERTRNNGFYKRSKFNKEINKHWYGYGALEERIKLQSEVIDAKTSASFNHWLD